MSSTKRVALLYAGSVDAKSGSPQSRPLPKVFEAFEALGVEPEGVLYRDDLRDEVKARLSRKDAVLVWVNPIEDGRDRSKLDALLRELSASGVFVSTHPDVILKLGTKEVLFQTRELGWGSDTHLYSSLEQMRRELPLRLSQGEARVLKQYRGHSGHGVWRVEAVKGSGPLNGISLVRARHAKTGCYEEVITLDEFFERCAPYFSAGQGRMIDQMYQARLPEGMVRCYLVKEKVEGFGIQEVVALHPAPQGAPPEAAPTPTKRHYHPATIPEFQRLKRLLEEDWLPAAQKLLQIKTSDLPMLWDCDFFFGPKDSNGNDTYVLCEINVSCVSPFPDSAAAPLARGVLAQISGPAK